MTDPANPPTNDAATWPPDSRRPSAGRATVYLAAFVVAIVGGAALFVSGLSLGRLQAASPGTGESRLEVFRPFWDAYNDITANYVGEVDERRLVEGAIKGVFEALGDPYSGYMTEEEYRNSLSGISGEFEGIGAELATLDERGEPCAPISQTCRATVMRVLRESPALAAGLQAGDAILAVDGKPTQDLTIELLVAQIRGPKGTTVTLTIERNGEQLEISIQRDVIRSEDVRSEILADGAVGYLKIENFSSSAASDLRAQLAELLEAGVTSVVLDLRDDPGGFVDAARRVASEFQDEGPLYWEQGAGRDPVPAQPEPDGVATEASLRLLVLVNGGTASASEIVAAALQGTGRAQLVGQPTFGKGTIQEWKELPGAGGYRLSVRKWLTPDQTWIHGEGLTPDVLVEVPAEPAPEGDAILERALEILAGDVATELMLAA